MSDHLPIRERTSESSPIGVIDIGSNSVRLVVYERLERAPTPLFNEKIMAGLGAGVAETGRLAEDAVEKTLNGLRRFAALAKQMRVGELDVLATAAAREAANGPAFLAEVEKICGVPVTLLSGPDEARVSALGIVSGFSDPDGIAGDLGGGSLELIDVNGSRVGKGDSLLLGGLRLQSGSKGSLKTAQEIARKALSGSSVLPNLKDRTFYAIGGTWRAMARLHMHQTGYPLHVMHGYRIAVDELQVFLETLLRREPEGIPGIEAVSKLRQTLLPFGATVLAEVLRIGKPKSVMISALGLREGHLFEKIPPREQAEDPLILAARELSVWRSRSPEHGDELVDWTEMAMDVLSIGERPEERRLRAAACHLADIGWRAHPDYRGEQSFNVIANASFIAVDHPGRAYLALAVYYRHAGLSDDELGSGIREIAPMRYRERARALAAAFRVAYLVSASMPGVIPRTQLRRNGKTIELVLPADLADLAGARLATRVKQLAAIGGFASRIRIAD
ncbi:exopolyphosphatase / guanosine-5'-triphosphate,3'-diphosphate pyrophosphatase [Faunimonas pinastri]|uniref:Exopolyphosphatase / guanosine-5'-triphosphate,3'-diphosphate pyrophosphatase n=1 Tax=Faunimonas pinastri TaxID=1855383 RepID=A0A1H9CBI6_9HYPH|nr:Ppx/GppA phosphatase family protein [Faunimonas pinastri]SEP98143.1 exopolyphosphatase / guanosine-5'-triphosphate,3'-diphosphate pyrophosphatase [Faunimonas pinastri]